MDRNLQIVVADAGTEHISAPASGRGFSEPLSGKHTNPISHTLPVSLIVLFQIFLLFIVGYRNPDCNDIDGVAYVRIAHYYATGNTDLMVSGYWGPLLSWLMVPCLWLKLDPFLAARIAMGISAVVFQLGCLAVFKAFGLRQGWLLLAFGVCALASVSWSVSQSSKLSPDLLLSGLLCFAISRIVDPNWLKQYRAAICAGCAWGVAYWAKAVAFPLALGISLGFAVLFIVVRAATPRRIVGQLAITLFAFALIAGPWVIALSFKYQRFTFSETARIAHTYIGPTDVERTHPIEGVMFRPEAGRVTAWEDPSQMSYRPWSPFENRQYALHQLKHITNNLWTIWCCLSESDVLSLGLLAACSALFLGRRKWREQLLCERWRWTLLPLACFIGIYLPVFAAAPRYYYATFPMFLILIAGCGQRLGATFPTRRNLVGKALVGLVIVSFYVPALGRLQKSIAGFPDGELRHARILAEKLTVAGLAGPMIGNLRDFPTYWVGVFTDQPWYGAATTPEACHQSGAALVVMRRDSLRGRPFENDPRFQNLDSILFGSTAEATNFPVKVFKILPN